MRSLYLRTRNRKPAVFMGNPQRNPKKHGKQTSLYEATNRLINGRRIYTSKFGGEYVCDERTNMYVPLELAVLRMQREQIAARVAEAGRFRRPDTDK